MVVDDCSEKGRELDVALALAGGRVDGSFGIGLGVFGGEELRMETGLPNGEFLNEFGTWIRGIVGSAKDCLGALGGFAEALVMSPLGWCLRMAFEITRVDDVIKFLFAFADNFAVGITELLLAVDSAFLLYCTVEFGKGVIQFNVSHIVWLF